MKTRKELLHSKGYWLATLQTELYRQIYSFMVSRKMNKTQLSDYLGCTKGYVSQLLNGDFDHKISKFIELALAIGKIPVITYRDIDDFIQEDCKTFNSNTPLNSCNFAKATEPSNIDTAA